jgi:DNA-binding response OmpR family regulator
MLAWFWKRLSDGGPEVTVSGRALRRFPEREVDRLLRARVLTEQRKTDSWSLCSHCDCGLDARPIREVDGRLVACCPHDAAEDQVLEPDDLRRFGIEPDRLAGALAASGGLTGGVTRIGDRIWLLGRVPSGRCLVLCGDVSALDAPGAVMALRSAAGTAPIMVIATEIDAASELRLREAGVGTSTLPACIVVDESGAEHLEVDRLSPVLGTPRLILSRSRQSATFDGRRLDLTPQMFALTRLFAEQAGQRDPVLRKEIIDAQTGRPANEIVRDLRKSLVGCGLSRAAAEALIVTVRGYGYRLGIAPAEVAVED